MSKSPARVDSKAHVVLPINTDGTTWLRESDPVEGEINDPMPNQRLIGSS